MSPVLHISDVYKSFSGGSPGREESAGTINVVNGLDLDLEAGSVTSLVGGNGVGKTTLFNMVSGLIRPDKGEVWYYGRSGAIDCTLGDPWRIAQAGIGRMFQGIRIFGEMSVMDNLLVQMRQGEGESPFYRLFKLRKSKLVDDQQKEMVYEKLRGFDEFYELYEDRSMLSSSLSYARQRLLSLAGLMLGGYELLLLDEPTSGIDPGSFETLRRFLQQMKKEGRTIFLIEHNMDFIRQVSDQCHYMAEGKIRYSGPPDKVLEQKEVKESYLL